MHRFPRLYAAASLKRAEVVHHRYASRAEVLISAALCRGLIEAGTQLRVIDAGYSARFPRLYAAASLKRGSSPGNAGTHVRRLISAALCRGLIEAALLHGRVAGAASDFGFPRLYAAASLKRPGLARCLSTSSAIRFPRLYAAASLKRQLSGASLGTHLPRCRFPRLYAAASLKPPRPLYKVARRARPISAALCRGLIEAMISQSASSARRSIRISAALCRGLIEAVPRAPCDQGSALVDFRGFMPRPH